MKSEKEKKKRESDFFSVSSKITVGSQPGAAPDEEKPTQNIHFVNAL